MRVVITPVFPLSGWSPAKLAAPENESVIEQAALFEVGDQSGDRLIHLGRKFGILFTQVLNHLSDETSNVTNAIGIKTI